ncbi:MAG: Rieske 2Fe-2S domain-containing protein [Burkholderiales bacterium]
MTPEESQLFSQTGPGTIMGDLLRRFWVPAVLSSELVAAGSPVRVRLYGENLVAFRNQDGRVGLFGESCAHRGASLYFGQNGNGGLRCWYHGWKYDLDGRCLETPNEPNDNLQKRVRQKAYPCIEKNGAVWAYLGPADSKPPLPSLEWLQVPEDQVFVSKRTQMCHWSQGMEGDLDPRHLAFLHAGTIDATEEHAGHASAEWLKQDLTPILEAVAKPVGLMFAARRNADAESYFWRVGQWMMPFFTTIPAFPGLGPLAGHAWVPADDGQCNVFTFSWHPTRALQKEELAMMHSGTAMHAALTPGSFQPLCNMGNEYAGPNGAPAKQPWMRIKRFQDQDICITESIGPQYDRAEENLGSSDAVIGRVRAMLMGAAKALREGREPPGRDPAEYRMRPISVQLPRTTTAWADEIAEAVDTRPETFRASV